jgi:hypothetical protein
MVERGLTFASTFGIDDVVLVGQLFTPALKPFVSVKKNLEAVVLSREEH